MNELRSSLDLHNYQPDIMKSSGSVSENSAKNKPPTVVCKTPSQALKIKDLASQVFENADLYDKYSSVKERKSSNH